MLITLDPTLTIPLYEQLASSIRAGIASGDIRSGEKLPGARELATSLDVNVHTVLRAYTVLREEGLLDVRRGRGAVITGRATDSLSADRARLGETVREAQELAHRLGLSTSELAALLTKGYDA